MSSFTSIARILQNAAIDQKITVEGWVRHFRQMKTMWFIHLTDGLSPKLLQVVVNPSITSNNLNVGCAVRVHGRLVKSPASKQPVELLCDRLELIGECPIDEYPLKPRIHYSSSYLRRMQHIRSRTSATPALLRVRQSLFNILHEFYQQREFVRIDNPLITGNDCEGAGETFSLKAKSKVTTNFEEKEQDDEKLSEEEKASLLETFGSGESLEESKKYFFAKPAYLTVSGQLHLEAMATGISRVYCINSCFRAEHQLSRNHLAEFYMLEAELSFCSDLNILMKLVEEMCRNVSEKLFSTGVEDLEAVLQFFNPDRLKLLDQFASNSFGKFVTMPYSDAFEALKKSNENFATLPKFGDSLKREHELWLCKYSGDRPVFVTHFPAAQKPFYMKRGGASALCFDLLVPNIGELVGGSLRENDAKLLEEKLKEIGALEQLKWYLQLRRWGHAPMGGFGMGFERMMQYLLGIQHIRDCLPFPRWYKHCML